MLNEPVLAAGTALTTGQLVVLDGPNYPGMPVYVVQSNTTAGALTSGITGNPSIRQCDQVGRFHGPYLGPTPYARLDIFE